MRQKQALVKSQTEDDEGVIPTASEEKKGLIKQEDEEEEVVEVEVEVEDLPPRVEVYRHDGGETLTFSYLFFYAFSYLFS